MSLLAISHAKQTLTLFKEGVPEGGGSSCGAAWVAEKKGESNGKQTKGGWQTLPSLYYKKVFVKLILIPEAYLLQKYKS